MSNYRAAFITRASRAFADTNPDAPVVGEEVWDGAVSDALGEFSVWYPSRRLLSLTLTGDDWEYDLPDDFLEIDLESFNQAVNPGNGYFVYNPPGHFELGQAVGLSTLISPYTVLPTLYGGSPVQFVPGSRFEFLDKIDETSGRAKKVLYLSPAPVAGTLAFIYLGLHILTDDAGEGQSLVPGVDTVQPEHKDLLVALCCWYACQAMQRRTASHKQYAINFRRLAEQYRARFDARTRKLIVSAG